MSKGAAKQFHYDSVSVNNPSISWNTDNSAIATVDSTGKVTAVNYGTTMIYAFIYYTKGDGSSGYDSRYFYIDVTLQSGTYFINNENSDYIIGYENYTNLNGNLQENAILEVIDRGSNAYVPPTANQRYMFFKIKNLGNGEFSIRSMLDSSMGWTDDGTGVVMTTIGTTDSAVPTNARWKIKYTSSGYMIYPANDPEVAVRGFPMVGADIDLVDYDSSDDIQKWNFTAMSISCHGIIWGNTPDYVPIGETVTFSVRGIYSTDLTVNGQRNITWSVASGTSFASINSSTGVLEGESVGIATVEAYYNSSVRSSVTIEIISVAEGTYFLENANLNHYMQVDDNENDKTSEDAFFELHDFCGEDYQKFSIEYLGNFYYKITCLHSGKALTAPSELNDSITQTTYNNLNSQKWYISALGCGTYKFYPQSYDPACMVAGVGLTYNGRNVELREEEANDGNGDEWYLHLASEYAYLTYDVRIYYDRSSTPSQIVSAFDQAAAGILEEFNIKFNMVSIGYSSQLNLSEECESIANNRECHGYNCGDYQLCNTIHHKSAHRLLTVITPSDICTLRAVSYALCSYKEVGNDEIHDVIFGAAYIGGQELVVSLTSGDLVKTMQHELSHVLGVPDECCTNGQFCVVNTTYQNANIRSVWCDNCTAIIKSNY